MRKILLSTALLSAFITGANAVNDAELYPWESHCPPKKALRAVLKEHKEDVIQGKSFTFNDGERTWEASRFMFISYSPETLETLPYKPTSSETLETVLARTVLIYNSDEGDESWAFAQFCPTKGNAIVGASEFTVELHQIKNNNTPVDNEGHPSEMHCPPKKALREILEEHKEDVIRGKPFTFKDGEKTWKAQYFKLLSRVPVGTIIAEAPITYDTDKDGSWAVVHFHDGSSNDKLVFQLVKEQNVPQNQNNNNNN